MDTITTHSHPDAPVRHSYPLTVPEPGLGTALSLMTRTLPYALVRFGVLVGFPLVGIVWCSRRTSGRRSSSRCSW